MILGIVNLLLAGLNLYYVLTLQGSILNILAVITCLFASGFSFAIASQNKA